jgi:hypothetical protein
VRRKVSDKTSAAQTEEYFVARARRVDPGKIAQALKRVGKGNAPMAGDELPKFVVRRKRSQAG